ncbi:MAG: hypothetical protein ACHQ6U_09675 [Thermodesulfobacteriota bacterium]
MRKISFAFLLIISPLSIYSCATVEQDIAGPAEPASSDTLENRAEPQNLDNKYNTELQEELESEVSPLQTEQREDQPPFK